MRAVCACSRISRARWRRAFWSSGEGCMPSVARSGPYSAKELHRIELERFEGSEAVGQRGRFGDRRGIELLGDVTVNTERLDVLDVRRASAQRPADRECAAPDGRKIAVSGRRSRLAQNPTNVRSTKSVIPAKAGIHRASVRAADKWVPAFAGTTHLGRRLIIQETFRSLFSFYTPTMRGHPRVNRVACVWRGNRGGAFRERRPCPPSIPRCCNRAPAPRSPRRRCRGYCRCRR